MFHRCLTLAALIASFTLVACGQSGSKRTLLRRTLGLGGRSALDARTLGKGCIDLKGVVKTIGSSSRGATLHSRDYDLGRALPKKGDHQLAFQSVTDAAGREELARRTVTGENAPVVKTSGQADSLLRESPARELLDVAEQPDCRTIKFTSGAEFLITYGNPSFVTMRNPQTGEIREYGRQGDSLTMTVFAPAAIKDCNGNPVAAETERISTRLAWGRDHDVIDLTKTYAARLNVNPRPTAADLKSTIGSLPTKSEAVKCAR